MPQHIKLHLWPIDDASVELPTLDPSSLAAILFLQLTCPQGYVIEPCIDVGSTPSGLLPYTSISTTTSPPDSPLAGHGIPSTSKPSSFGGIVNSLPTYRDKLDGSLAEEDYAKSIAWKSYVVANLGNLVAYNLYGHTTNYYTFTRPHLASHLSIPTRYYVPDRLREVWKDRLESEGMWEADLEDSENPRRSLLPTLTFGWLGSNTAKEEEGKEVKATAVSVGPTSPTSSAVPSTVPNTVPGVALEKDKLTQKQEEKIEQGRKTIKKAFGRQKVLEQAKTTLDLLERQLLISSTRYFFSDSPTTLDILLAAHILVLLRAPVPDSQLTSLIVNSHKRLFEHAADLGKVLDEALSRSSSKSSKSTSKEKS